MKFLIILVLVVVLLYLFRGKIKEQLGGDQFFGNKPSRPNIQVSVIYKIGWWPNQESLKVEAFEVNIVKSQLNLFNSYSLVSYRIKGILKHNKGWKPYLKNIHLSERFHPAEDLRREAIIEVTPVVKVREDEKYTGEEVFFEIENQHMFQSFQWGENKIILHCGGIEREILLMQRK